MIKTKTLVNELRVRNVLLNACYDNGFKNNLTDRAVARIVKEVVGLVKKSGKAISIESAYAGCNKFDRPYVEGIFKFGSEIITIKKYVL